MTNLEFYQKYGSYAPNEKIVYICEQCNCTKYQRKDKLGQKLTKYGYLFCKPCCQKMRFKDGLAPETIEKLRKGRLGYVNSDESKKKMSEAKKALFQTPYGKELKRKLSKSTAMKHSKNLFNKSKRKGLFKSGKMNALIPYGSSYEMRLCWLLEQDKTVISYETQLFYQVEDRSRCLDFLVTYEQCKTAIEVKPFKRLTEQKNINQINDSQANAIANGWNFKVVTEKELGLANSDQITKWSDELKASLGEENYIEYRKFRNRVKVLKYYYKSIATNKVQVHCKFCSDKDGIEVIHTALKLTHDKNIKRNGRYICEREGGHIAGSRPKPHLQKVNQYASEGKKECTGPCKSVKEFSEFGFDKSRFDGYASRCKICRNGKVK